MAATGASGWRRQSRCRLPQRFPEWGGCICIHGVATAGDAGLPANTPVLRQPSLPIEPARLRRVKSQAMTSRAPATQTAAVLPLTTAPLLAVPIVRYRLTFAPADGWRGAEGTAWRGGFGHALRARVCRTGAPNCDGCPFTDTCAFPLFFPAAVKDRADVDADERIVPLALDAGGTGKSPWLECTLLGPGTAHAAMVVQALAMAADNGIGPARTRLRAAQIAQEQPPGSNQWSPTLNNPAPVPPPPELPAGTIALHLRSPLRLRHEGVYIRPETFTFADLASSLLRRASALLAQAGLTAQIDYRRLGAMARAVLWRSTDLRWEEFERRSDVQQSTMKVGGIVGHCSLDSAGLEPFWPLLWLGQWLRAGKFTSAGFGRYTLSADA